MESYILWNSYYGIVVKDRIPLQRVVYSILLGEINSCKTMRMGIQFPTIHVMSTNFK